MHRRLLEILADPIFKTPSRLEAGQCGMGDEIIEGLLHSRKGRSYPIFNGIPLSSSQRIRTKNRLRTVSVINGSSEIRMIPHRYTQSDKNGW